MTAAAEFQALLAEHQGLEPLLAFALVSNAAELRTNHPDTADGMLAWAHTVRNGQFTDNLCGSDD